MPFQVPFNRLLLATLLIVSVVAVGQGVANLVGLKVFVLDGHSMEPTIVAGSLVVAHEVAVDDLEIGDVALFRVGWLKPGVDVTAAHRITDMVAEDGGLLAYTKGDGNKIADPIPTLFEGSAVRADFTVANGSQLIRFAGLVGVSLIFAYIYVALVTIIAGLITAVAPRSRSQASIGA